MGQSARASRRRESGYEGLVVRTPRREDPNEIGVERPEGTQVAIERPDATHLTIRYGNSDAWAARKFIYAWLWIGLAVLPSLAWGDDVYTNPVYLGLLVMFSYSALLQYLLAAAGKTPGVIMPYFVLRLGTGVFIVVVLLVAGVFAKAGVVRARPFISGFAWLVSVAAVVHWLCVRFGASEIRVDPEQFVHAVCVFGWSRTRRWPTTRIEAVGSRRPGPPSVAPYPRWGLWPDYSRHGRNGAVVWIIVAVGSYLAVRTSSRLAGILYGITAGALLAGYIVLLTVVSRPTYPLFASTPRREYRFGWYLTKQEQWWIAYELRQFMAELGQPVRRTLYRP